MDAREIVERIMTCHWDTEACRCWICTAGRELGFGSFDKYLQHKHDNALKYPDPSDHDAMRRAISFVEAEKDG